MCLLYATLISLSSACASDGDLLYVKTSTTQPDDPVYGRLVSVFAASGDPDARTHLFVRVSGGTFVDPVDPQPTDSLCKQLATNDDKLPRSEILEQRIAVVPTDNEAIIYAVLRNDSCDGAVRTEIAVPIQRAGDQPTVDGGM